MITFKHPAGNHPAISVDGALSASPDTATVAATTIANGGLYMNPIYGDFLRTAHDTPQVKNNCKYWSLKILFMYGHKTSWSVNIVGLVR